MNNLISMLIPLFLINSFASFSQVSFTQSSNEDFQFGSASSLLIENGTVHLPNQTDSIEPFVSTTNLPANLTGHRTVTWKNFSYLIGGFNGSSYTNTVYKASLGSSGIGNWSSINSLPVALQFHAAVVALNHIYVLGGNANGTISDAIYFAEINSDGSIGNWQTSAINLPQPLWGHCCNYVNGYLYVVGGGNQSNATSAINNVYVAKVEPNGNLFAFSATTNLPSIRNGHTMVNYDGKLIVCGGFDTTAIKQNTVYYTSTNADGSCNNWFSGTALPISVSNHSSVCTNGIISVICGDIGGAVPLIRKVYYTNADDYPNFTWIESNNELSDRRKDGQAFTINGNIFYVGGELLSGTPTNSARYANLNLTTALVKQGSYVSYPFVFGSEKDIDSLAYSIQYINPGSSYEILYRFSGINAQWGNWISGGQSNPVPIVQTKSYIQYRVDFQSNGLVDVVLEDMNVYISGYTQISGNLNSIDTFYTAASPYWATGDISFTAGSHYFEPGVTIVFSPNTGMEVGQASITCDGNANDSVIFTNYGSEIGQWNGIFFNTDSDNGVSSVFRYTKIEKAGNGSWNANLYCSNTNQPHLINSVIQSGEGHGIRLESANLTLDTCSVIQNLESGIYLNTSNPVLNYVNTSYNEFAGIYYQGTGLNPSYNYCQIEGNTFGIYAPSPDNSFSPPGASSYLFVNNIADIALGGGTITVDRTWAYFENGYAILGNLVIKKSGDNPRLTIAPGNKMKFAEGTSVQIGGTSSYGGELYAEGTVTQKITFTSLNESVGGWNGLLFDSGSDSYSSTSSLKYCVIEKANSYNLKVQNSNEPFILYCEIEESNNIGLYLNNADITIEETSVSNNAQYGFYMDDSDPSLVLVDMDGNGSTAIYYPNTSSNPSFFSCSIQNCDYGFFYPSPNLSFQGISGTINFNNILAAIAVPGGTIDANNYWSYIEAGYVILDDITISIYSNARLTIAPGNTLKFSSGSKINIANPNNNVNYGRGELYAVGTSDSLITFTALNDSVGGWEGIQFYSGSDYNGAVSSLKYCIIENAIVHNVYCRYTNQPTIDSCIIRHSSKYGMFVSDESSPQIQNCQFENNILYGIYYKDPDYTENFNNLSFIGNGIDGIIINEGHISSNKYWSYIEAGYTILGDISVYKSGSNVRLIIAPGNVLKFSSGSRINIGHPNNNINYGVGELYAVGTSDSLITFTSLNDSVGGWEGIRFWSGSGSDYYGTISSLNHCILEKANVHNVYCINTNQPTIDSCIIRYSSNYGMYVSDQSTPQIQNCQFENNVLYGIYYKDPNYAENFNNLSFTGNGIDGVVINEGQISSNKYWSYIEAGYSILGDISVYGANPRLTIAPGNILKFISGSRINIANPDNNSGYWERGELYAVGTSDSLITFTSLNDSIGGWEGLRYFNSSDYVYSNNGNTSSLKHCVLKNAIYGIYCYSTIQPAINNCRIIYNQNYGIALTGTSQLTIGNTDSTGCDLYYNGQYDIYNGTSNTINAKYNFWNTLDPNLIGIRIFDYFDNNSYGEVIFEPFVNTGSVTSDTFEISGQIYYSNFSLAAMTYQNIIAIDFNGDIIDSSFTDNQGYFNFNQITNGVYSISPSGSSWGGVNATDALKIMQHFVFISPLDSIFLEAADVNGSGTVNGTDALWVKKRTIGLVNTFPAGDWIMKTTPSNLVVYGKDTSCTIAALCYGDVNGSYLPSWQTKNGLLNMQVVEEPTLYVFSNDKLISVPITVKEGFDFCAATIVIELPQDNLQVQDVSFAPSKFVGSPAFYNIQNGILRISWADLDPIKLNGGDTLLTLIVSIDNSSVLLNKELQFKLLQESEIADSYAQIIPYIQLSIPKIIIAEDISDYILNIYPNPFREETNIFYDLTESSQVSIEVYDLLGKKLTQLVNTQQTAGQYSVRFDAKNLPAGVYLIKLDAVGTKKRHHQIVKLVKEN